MKDSYYFPHFSVARNDRKIRRLRKQLGIEGYGIYFMLLEVLREQTDFQYPLADLDLLADEIGTSEEKVKVVIMNYDLFQIQDEHFFSVKLIEYLQPYLQKSQRARKAALKRWNREEDANAYANALPMQSKSNANQNASKVKERKESKVKEEEESKRARANAHKLEYHESDFDSTGNSDQKSDKPPDISPTREEWMNFCTMHAFHPEYAEHIYNHMESVGWLDTQGRRVTNWQSHAKNKFKYQNEFLQRLKNEKTSNNYFNGSQSQTYGQLHEAHILNPNEV